MNRRIRRFATGLLAMGAFSSAVSADQGAASSPFPVSTMYGSADQRTFPSATGGAPGYVSRFPAYGAYQGSYSTPSHTAGQVVGGTAYVAMKLFPPLMLVMLPVAAVVLVAKGIDAAVSSAKSVE